MNPWGLADKTTCLVLNIMTTGEGKDMYESDLAFFRRYPDILRSV